MQSSPSSVYSQSIDKQRIVVVGKNKARIVEMIAFVLTNCKRKFDISSAVTESIANEASIVIEANGDLNELKKYQHHILILSQLTSTEKEAYSSLADATPKSGGIFYDETDDVAKAIAKKERADVVAIPFGMPKYEIQNGKAVLVSSTNEKFPTHLSAGEDLKSCSAAKELLKKIGISSSQFYKAISTVQ